MDTYENLKNEVIKNLNTGNSFYEAATRAIQMMKTQGFIIQKADEETMANELQKGEAMLNLISKGLFNDGEIDEEK